MAMFGAMSLFDSVVDAFSRDTGLRQAHSASFGGGGFGGLGGFSGLGSGWTSGIWGSFRADSGRIVTPANALSVSTIYRAIDVIAATIAMVPLVVYRREDDDSREKARDHPAWPLLHNKPAPWITSNRWRHLLITEAILHGNHYCEIMPGPKGIGGLAPLHPSVTRPVELMEDGSMVYVTRAQNKNGFGEERRLHSDMVLHIRGFSLDGRCGLPLSWFARNAIGISLEGEAHGSNFLRNGARFTGILSSDGVMDEAVREKNEEVWNKNQGGSHASGRTPFLSGGIKYQPISANHRESQWIESRKFEVEELLRFIGVPGVLAGHPDKSATYASAEQFFQSFVTNTIQPWAENIEAELNDSVLVGGDQFYAELLLDSLLRGDLKSRYEAHQRSISSGWKNRNEVRREENYNRGPDDLDEFLSPMNMETAGATASGSMPTGENLE